MEMSGLEYIGSLAIMAIFFWALVNLSPKDPNWEKNQLPEFGLEPTKDEILKMQKKERRKKKKKKKKKKKSSR